VVICCDTSFLFSLYGSDVHSARAVAWVTGLTSSIAITPLTQFEFGNALRLGEFRGLLKSAAVAHYWAMFESAIAQRRIVVEVCNLADVVNEANRLSATHTAHAGHRAFDILHVAAALKLGATEFLTFDQNQKKLAQAERLKTPLLR
jgi:predicted nucleic acid-binding protein